MAEREKLGLLANRILKIAKHPLARGDSVVQVTRTYKPDDRGGGQGFRRETRVARFWDEKDAGGENYVRYGRITVTQVTDGKEKIIPQDREHMSSEIISYRLVGGATILTNKTTVHEQVIILEARWGPPVAI